MTARVVVLGGGLAGMAAAWALARAGQRVTVVERGAEPGGLAGSFEVDGRDYPLAYHHVLHRDRALLWFLERIGALERVRWRRIRMLFRLGGRLYDLAHPVDFARFPLGVADKLRFVRLMLRCFRRDDWSAWHDRGAAELVDRWAGPGVRRTLFEPLTRLKFDLPCEDVSAAWLGARLHFREGSAPLGYIPGTTWTRVLCDGVAGLLEEAGVETRLATSVEGVEIRGGRAVAVTTSAGGRLAADHVVSTVPTEVYRGWLPDDATPPLDRIAYTAIVSAVCATSQPVTPDFYWMNLADLDCAASGLFRLESLNPGIGLPGESTLNFVTHVPHRDRPFFAATDDEVRAAYADDFRRIFGADLEPSWWRIGRLPLYSPVFRRGYRNPPARSATYDNVWFAGNYRTFPSIASTGTALASGLDAAGRLLSAAGVAHDDLARQAAAHRLRAMPRDA